MPYRPANRLLYLLKQAGFEATTRTQFGFLIAPNVRLDEGYIIITKYRDGRGMMQWFKEPPRVELN